MSTRTYNQAAWKEQMTSFSGLFARMGIVLLTLLVLFSSGVNSVSAQVTPPQGMMTEYSFGYEQLGILGWSKKSSSPLQIKKACEDARATLDKRLDIRNLGACVQIFIQPGNPQITVASGSDAADSAKVMDAAAQRNADAGGMGSILEGTVGQLLEAIAHLIFWAASLFMTGMGLLLDLSIQKTIDSSLYKGLTVIQTGWTIMRDFANMFFIFILLYIAVTTILGMAGHNTKTMLRNVIIAALLINFSLFITQVVVDAGNVIAVGFYNQIQTKQGATMERGPSKALKQGLDLQSILDTKGDGSQLGSGRIELPHSKRAMIWAGGAILMLIAGYVFFAGAIMMIIRSISLIFLMIFSPVAFVGFLLPKTSGAAQGWWKKLLEETILAPAFCIMLYLVVLIIQSNDLVHITNKTDADTFGTMLSGQVSSFEIMYNYFILCGLMLACLKVASAVSGSTASAATKWAKTGTGMIAGATIGTAAYAGRQTVGAAGRKIADSEWAQNKAKTTRWGGTLVNISDKAGKSSFDVRASKVGAAGLGATIGAAGINAGKAGGEGGFTKTGSAWNKITAGDNGYAGTAKDEAVVKKAKELFPGNPAAQDKYIRSHLGTKMVKSKETINGQERTVYTQTSRVDDKNNKTLKTEKERIKGEMANKEAKDKVVAGTKELKTRTAAELAAITASGKTVGVEIAESIAENLKKLSNKATADLDENILANDVVQRNLSSSQLAEIQKKAADPATGYQSATLLPNMTRNILDNGNTDGKNYIKRQIASGTASSFKYDYEGELRTQMKAYDKAKVVGDQVTMARAEGEMRSIIGRVDAKDIADLKEEFHEHEGVAATYKTAHITAIQKRQKDKGDLSEDFIQKFHANVQANNADKGAKKLINEATTNKKSALFSEKITQKRIDDIKKPGGLLENARNLAANPALSPADRATMQAEVDRLDKEAAKLEKTLNEP